MNQSLSCTTAELGQTKYSLLKYFDVHVGHIYFDVHVDRNVIYK